MSSESLLPLHDFFSKHAAKSPSRRTLVLSFISFTTILSAIIWLLIIQPSWLFLRLERVFPDHPAQYHASGAPIINRTVINIAPQSFQNELSNLDTRPSWLSKPPSTPLIIRLAILSRADGFTRRAAFREAMLSGIPAIDVTLKHVFVVGHDVYPIQFNTTGSLVDSSVLAEQKEFNDLLILPMKDSLQRMAEKRYRAIQWGGFVPRESYDWFMTVDDDSFVRFPALARRLAVDPRFLARGDRVAEIGALDPRTDPIIIARMSKYQAFWNNTIPDIPNPGIAEVKEGEFVPDSTAEENIMKEDARMKGPWFPYPVGIGYLLSSSLIPMLVSANPPIPHHVAYDLDDVIIGSWIASLWMFHPSLPLLKPNRHTFVLTDGKKPRWPIVQVFPRPHTPKPIQTTIIDDQEGWHDFPYRGAFKQIKIGWNSVAVHKISPGEMRSMREKFRDEYTIGVNDFQEEPASNNTIIPP